MKAISIILIILIITVFTSSCFKAEDAFKRRYTGYIYNSENKQPFSNTKFKFYQRTGWNNAAEENFFTTDEKGFFDVTYNKYVGALVWPSYHSGAAYFGPKQFEAKSDFQDINNRISTTFYDTVYSKEWY